MNLKQLIILMVGATEAQAKSIIRGTWYHDLLTSLIGENMDTIETIRVEKGLIPGCTEIVKTTKKDCIIIEYKHTTTKEE